MEQLITITGLDYYLGKKAYKVGRILRIEKEPDNEHDSEAIRVLLPVIGTVGYVANSIGTVYDGTMSAGRLYESFERRAYVQVLVITRSSVIARLLPEEVAATYDALYDLPGLDPMAGG